MQIGSEELLEWFAKMYNLEGEIYFLKLESGTEPLILQIANYFANESSDSCPGEDNTATGPNHPKGPTAIRLYELNGIPYANLSLRFAESELLPVGVFYGKAYSENEEIFANLLKEGVVEKVEQYPALEFGYARTAEAYRLGPEWARQAIKIQK